VLHTIASDVLCVHCTSRMTSNSSSSAHVRLLLNLTAVIRHRGATSTVVKQQGDMHTVVVNVVALW
jgi:hypothetical protein